MTPGALSDALEQEHRDIDGGIEEYTAGLSHDDTDPGPLLRAMRGLRRHIYLEEEILFPPLNTGGLTMPILVMVREHGELWDAMDALETHLASEADAETLQNACRELLAKLDAHNRKEEPIIYTQADVALEDTASARLREFLETGLTPEGWRCARSTPAAA